MQKLKSHPVYKVSKDVYLLQMLWALLVLGAIVLIHFLLGIFVRDLAWIDRSALSALANPIQVFMLIFGIIGGAYFLKHFIRHGVTRKHCFAGVLISGVLAVVSLQIVALLLTFLSYGIEALAPYEAGRETIAYLGQERGYLVSMIVNAALTLVYYIFGWLIGIGFYRYKVLRGFAFILLAVFVLGIIGTMWLPESEWNFMGISLNLIDTSRLWVAFLITDATLLLGILLLYAIYRKAPVSPH